MAIVVMQLSPVSIVPLLFKEHLINPTTLVWPRQRNFKSTFTKTRWDHLMLIIQEQFGSCVCCIRMLLLLHLSKASQSPRRLLLPPPSLFLLWINWMKRRERPIPTRRKKKSLNLKSQRAAAACQHGALMSWTRTNQRTCKTHWSTFWREA